jgi:glycosyltransferase involved in cell wall biosynthesis
VLDHGGYGDAFHAAWREMGLQDAVRVIGPVAQAEMPALYRAADVLVFPSVKEGFGLAVLEAMASGIAVVTSRIAPFTEYLGERDVAWCDPYEPESISQAIFEALDSRLRDGWIARGAAVAALHGWERTAAAHLNIYQQMLELQDA